MSRFLLCFVALSLAACSTTQAPLRSSPSAPPVSKPQQAMPGTPASVARPVSPEAVLPPTSLPPLPTPPAVAQPPRQLADGSRVPAVHALLQSAQQQMAAGNLPAAAASLERAQRLAPQSWQVYARLAEVRLRQARPAEAEQLARKALGFAPEAAQQAQAWRLIARTRQQQGQGTAAQAALERAQQLETQP